MAASQLYFPYRPQQFLFSQCLTMLPPVKKQTQTKPRSAENAITVTFGLIFFLISQHFSKVVSALGI